MDAAEPPRIVFESPAQCRESDRAEELLRRALAPAKAPGAGWSVSMRVDPTAARGLRAEGEVTDGDGVSVAHRTITGATADCGGLAKAVGVWATLVLDAELRKAHGRTPDARAAVGTTVAGGSHASTGAAGGSSSPGGGAGSGGGGGGYGAGPGGGETAGGTPDAAQSTGAGAVGAEPVAAWPAPAPEEKASPEHDWYLHHDETRTLELGAGMFLASGAGGGAIAGPSAFVVIEAGHGIFLRPGLAFGKSITSLPPSNVDAATWGAGRFDACIRMPGLYSRHHGMQLDLCGGTDIGMTVIDATNTISHVRASTSVPYWDIGPSLDLRGELGSRLSAVLRAVVGVDLLSETYTDDTGGSPHVPIVDGRLELAFSWDVR